MLGRDLLMFLKGGFVLKNLFVSYNKEKEVLYLKRLSFGGITLDKSLSEGEWRNLTSEELETLKNN